MSPRIARLFVFGFGLELGSIIALCLWADIDHVTIPLVCAGALMMALALGWSTK